MKYYELFECVKFLQKFKSINRISRVEDNTLKIDFQAFTLYADMKRGASTLFICDDFQKGRYYQAPFDIVLSQRFSNVSIESLNIVGEDRIIALKVLQKSSYKIVRSTLLLEFTGRNTNAIILDENEIVIEALRHVNASCRMVKVGEKLTPLPKHQADKNSKPANIDDIKSFLYKEHEKIQIDSLQNLKNSKSLSLEKKIVKLKMLLDTLESEEELEAKAKDFNQKAMLLLSNRHLLTEYTKECAIKDEDGNIHKITLVNNDIQNTIDEFFTKSKRLKQRSKSIYVERENLKEKFKFLNRLLEAVLSAKSKEEVEILLPKTASKTKNDVQNSLFGTFFADGYKVMVGKSEKGNAELLKVAKKNDIWFHVKDIPSSHVILKTDKKSVSDNTIAFCAKLCLSFSGVNTGVYEVDYTKRQNLKVIEKAHVNYVDYKTIRVQKG
ncbi:MAG: NFACT RNA binding domain-containing protein [Campylobacteraceae bacterium]|jgi:predicted ribosome quality control (RQC) complex YloA/Tae2 family protein|nr:NFACT RNA binding domain-containing protein [Campylobacteraceae bacterium]